MSSRAHGGAATVSMYMTRVMKDAAVQQWYQRGVQATWTFFGEHLAVVVVLVLVVDVVVSPRLINFLDPLRCCHLPHYLRRGNGTKPLWVSRLAYISLSHVLHEACVVSRANPKGLSSSTSEILRQAVNVIAKAKLGTLEIPPASRTSTKRIHPIPQPITSTKLSTTVLFSCISFWASIGS